MCAVGRGHKLRTSGMGIRASWAGGAKAWMLTRSPVHIFSVWPGFSKDENNCRGNQTAGYSSGGSVA